MGHGMDFSRTYESNNVLADGWYNVKVDDRDLEDPSKNGAVYKTSKASGVDYLNLRLRTDGNRVVFSMYNIFNKSDEARNIAMKQIKEILIYQGSDVSKLKEVSKEGLLDLLMNGGWFKVLLGNRTDDYGTKNIIKAYDKTDLDAASIKKVQDSMIAKKKVNSDFDPDSIPF